MPSYLPLSTRTPNHLAGLIRTPFQRRRYRPNCPGRQSAVNRCHPRVRAPGQRANATLKTWKVLGELRCCPRRATVIVQALLVLHHLEASRYAGWLGN